jgi:anti-sigma factor ChrR (cupin superfamily)
MPATTPFLKGEDKLAPLASRYVDVAALPWQETRFPGVKMKVLLEDKESGLVTGLFRFEPGARLPYHEHVEIEQSWVLEGSLADEEGEATAGNFVWRPAGNRHDAWSPKGCLVLSVFLKPNKFMDKNSTGWDTKGSGT